MTELEIFINKAKNKIADLGSCYRKSGDKDNLRLLLMLSNFLETLCCGELDIDEDHLLRLIHYYNKLAELNLIPYLQMVDYYSCVINGEGNDRGDIYSYDIVDFDIAVNRLIGLFPHNSLSGIQGGKPGERYHIDAVEYEWVKNGARPLVNPSVTLNLVTIPTHLPYLEKGIPVTKSTLTPIVNKENDEIVGIRYYRNGEIMGGETTELLPKVDNSLITEETVYRMEVDFEDSGTKVDNQIIKFYAPIWYGNTVSGANVTTVKSLTKLVTPISKTLELTYSLPDSNASSLTPQYFRFLISKEWGEIKSIYVNGFNSIDDWNITSSVVNLNDGSDNDYWNGEFGNITAGTFTMIFNF